MKKKIDNSEIDLSEIIITLLNNKFKIVLITFITLFFTLTILLINPKSTPKSIFIAETEIISNSIFEDYKYQAFNSFVDGLIKKNPFFMEQKNFQLDDKENSITIVPDNIKNYNVFSNFDFEKIDRFVLYELFIEKLNQKDFFLETVVKFGLVNKDDYKDNDDYEKAVLKLASSIKIEKIIGDEKNILVKIKSKTHNKENWEKFLKFLEKSANEEVQNYLKRKFELLVLNINQINDYIIEDINFEISTSFDTNKILTLKKIKKRIVENQDVNRLVSLYEDTSIMNSDNFSSGKIKIQSTKYKDITKYPDSKKSTIIISLLLGLLLGIIYVLFTNASNKRR